MDHWLLISERVDEAGTKVVGVKRRCWGWEMFLRKNLHCIVTNWKGQGHISDEPTCLAWETGQVMRPLDREIHEKKGFGEVLIVGSSISNTLRLKNLQVGDFHKDIQVKILRATLFWISEGKQVLELWGYVDLYITAAVGTTRQISFTGIEECQHSSLKKKKERERERRWRLWRKWKMNTLRQKNSTRTEHLGFK